uniref:(California timema) hypothetical protein n=1 Tax=Timema californicum TaxID=61474 RepID=A0A7R9P5Z8_TIMCA|nr:unnamed protein product [Timema californicum]
MRKWAMERDEDRAEGDTDEDWKIYRILCQDYDFDMSLLMSDKETYVSMTTMGLYLCIQLKLGYLLFLYRGCLGSSKSLSLYNFINLSSRNGPANLSQTSKRPTFRSDRLSARTRNEGAIDASRCVFTLDVGASSMFTDSSPHLLSPRAKQYLASTSPQGRY